MRRIRNKSKKRHAARLAEIESGTGYKKRKACTRLISYQSV